MRAVRETDTKEAAPCPSGGNWKPSFILRGLCRGSSFASLQDESSDSLKTTVTLLRDTTLGSAAVSLVVLLRGSA